MTTSLPVHGIDEDPVSDNFTSTRNACKLCTPLGATMVFKGVQRGIPLLHGSQGCATYMRRYMISHFREPVDIASSNFTEEAAIYGGEKTFHQALVNIIRQYNPGIVGVATTCLSETIGDDIGMYLKSFFKEMGDDLPCPIVHVSTPSYSGTHADGYHAAVYALADQMAERHSPMANNGKINVMPGMVSPADLRHIKEVFADFGLKQILLPDYSDTLDGQSWPEYQKLPEGGTSVEDLKAMGAARASIEFTSTLGKDKSAAQLLQSKFDIPAHRFHLPIGISETDKFMQLLEKLSGRKTPQRHLEERARLVDAYIDGHKYVFGRKALLYGEEDLVVALANFCNEIGVVPAVVATGAKGGKLKEKIDQVTQTVAATADSEIQVFEGVDFVTMQERIADQEIDFMLGSSKGYKLSLALDIPLIRLGFPIHDRFGGQRTLHLGYRGAQQLFDRIVNQAIETKQALLPPGYHYM